MDLMLHGRVAMVTGSSQGIGRATAMLFGRESARVVVTYRSNEAKATAVVESIRSAGGDAFACQLDLASPDSIHAAVDSVRQRWDAVDILVSNAIQWGSRTVGTALPFEQLPRHEWQPLIRANLEGTYSIIQAVLPSMKQRRWGRIVTVSSTVAVDGLEGAGWYSAVKGASNGITKTLARELTGSGVLVNAVLPGPTLTERVAERLRSPAGQPRGPRRLLAPDEVAPIVVFLCSPVNTAISGDLISITAGLPTPSRILPNAASLTTSVPG